MNRIYLVLAIVITILTLTFFCNPYVNVFLFLSTFLIWIIAFDHISDSPNQKEKKIIEKIESIFKEE